MKATGLAAGLAVLGRRPPIGPLPAARPAPPLARPVRPSPPGCRRRDRALAGRCRVSPSARDKHPATSPGPCPGHQRGPLPTPAESLNEGTLRYRFLRLPIPTSGKSKHGFAVDLERPQRRRRLRITNKRGAQHPSTNPAELGGHRRLWSLPTPSVHERRVVRANAPMTRSRGPCYACPRACAERDARSQKNRRCPNTTVPGVPQTCHTGRWTEVDNGH